MARTYNYRGERSERILLYWQRPDDLSLYSTRALYLMMKVGGRKVLYIGKAGKQSINARFKCRSKDRWVKKGIKSDTLLVPLVAGFTTTRTATAELIKDVEKLLIFLVQPELNGPHKKSLTLHYSDILVECDGLWPHPSKFFSYYRDLPRLLVMYSGQTLPDHRNSLK